VLFVFSKRSDLFGSVKPWKKFSLFFQPLEKKGVLKSKLFQGLETHVMLSAFTNPCGEKYGHGNRIRAGGAVGFRGG
jgi:hypothetical protein